MPKSKRAKVVHTSKVDKKGKEHSQKLFDAIRAAADQHQHIFVFSVDNMRNTYLKDVRAEFADSRIFFGRTKIMAKSLGGTPSTEHLPNLSRLAAHLRGNVGLLFTSRPPDLVSEYFVGFAAMDYARAGTAAAHGFVVPAGVVYSRGGAVAVEDDAPVPASVETQLRKLGMPTRLVKGKVVLDAEYVIVREGQVMDSRQASLLKMFGVAMAEFRVGLKAWWSAESQEVKVLEGEGGGDGGEAEEEDD